MHWLGHKRGASRLAAALVLALALVLAASSSASAAPLAGSSYDSSDGNQESGPVLFTDWQDDQSQVRESPDELAPTADVCFGGGLKEDTPRDWFFNTTAGGCDPAKSDLFAAWSRSEMTATTSFLHMAFKRNATTGNTFITFELNQTQNTWINSKGTTIPCRSNGDLLLSYEVGGSSLNVTVYRWSGDGTGPAACPNGANGTFTNGASQNLGTMNTSEIANHLNAARYGATFDSGSFGEAQIDLPEALASMGQSRCFNFLQVQAHTRSSSSISSALIDYVKPTPAYISSCSAAGTVYTDANRNGTQDGGETGIAGRVVYVDLNGDGVGDANEPSATTDASGYYAIAGVPSGAYAIREVVPAGTVCTNSGGCSYTRSFAQPGNSTANDFGNYAPTGRIAGVVFDDADRDGDRDSGEAALAGVSVQLLDSNGTQLITTQTDPNGAYSFGSLPAGDYEVDPEQAADRVPTSADPESVTLAEAEQKTADFGSRLANRPPVADNESYSTLEDSQLEAAAPGGLDGDSDPDGSPLIARVDSVPLKGSLVLNSDGSFTYTPEKDFHGSDFFTYRACDDESPQLCSAPATVTLAVVAVNDDPGAGDDKATTAEDTATAVNVLANDTDVDGDRLTVSDFGQPTHGAVDCTAAGVCTYSPDEDFSGEDSFRYTVSDDHGGTATATVSLTVTPANDAPRADADLHETTEDEELIVAAPGVLEGDSDPDGDSLSAELVDGPAHGGLTLSPDGSFTYTPERNVSGEDSFTYRACDDRDPRLCSAPATVTLAVAPSNDPPVADDEGTRTDEDTPVEVNVLEGDTDAEGDELTVTGTSRPEHGTVSCTVAGGCAYTPTLNYSGADSFIYTVADGKGGTDTGEVRIDVIPVNDDPAADDDSAETTENDSVEIDVLEGDSDPEGDDLSIAQTSDPERGSVDCGSGRCTYTPDGGFVGTDSFTYTVSDGKGGTDTGEVTIEVAEDPPPPGSIGDLVFDDANGDGDRDSGEDGIEGVTVRLLDEEGNELATTETDTDGGYRFDDLAAGSYEVRIDEPRGFAVTAGGDPQSLPLGPGEDARSIDFGLQRRDAAIGGLAFEDLDGDGGRDLGERVLDRVTVRLFDAEGEDLATTETDPDGLYGFSALAARAYEVRVDEPVGFDSEPARSASLSPGERQDVDFGLDPSDPPPPDNRAPVADDETAQTAENTSVEIDVLDGDFDLDGDELSITDHLDPEHGSAECKGGRCTYTPDEGFAGTDSFDYTVSDGNGGTDTAKVTIEVTENGVEPPVNRDPDASDDTESTVEETPVVIRVLANDSDPDGDALSVLRSTQPAHGVVTRRRGGRLVYTPDEGFTGSDSSDYTVSDGRGGTATATVTITVDPAPEPGNSPPTPQNDQAVLARGDEVVIDVLDDDSDPDGDELRLVDWVQPEHGTVDCDKTGRCTYTPDPNFSGTDRFTYTVSDGHGGTRSASVTVRVLAKADSSTPREDPPAAGGGSDDRSSGGEAASSDADETPAANSGSPADVGEGPDPGSPVADESSSPEAPAPAAAADGSLPLTGLGLGLVAMLGLGLLAAGLAGRLSLGDPRRPRREG